MTLSADPLKPLHPGSPLPTDAATWNPMLAAARAFARGKMGPLAAGSPRGTLTPAVEVYARNDTGGDLDVGAVVRLDGSPLDPDDVPDEFRTQPVLSGTAPTAATNAVGVYSEAVPDGEIGRAVVLGVAACDVDVLDAADRYAAPVAGNTGRLVSSRTAAAARLVVNPGVGVRPAVVLLQSWGGSGGAEGSGSGSGAGSGGGPAFTPGCDGFTVYQYACDPGSLNLLETAITYEVCIDATGTVAVTEV